MIRRWMRSQSKQQTCRFCRNDGCAFCVEVPARPAWGDPLGTGVRVIRAAASTAVEAARAYTPQLPPAAWEREEIYSSI